MTTLVRQCDKCAKGLDVKDAVYCLNPPLRMCRECADETYSLASAACSMPIEPITEKEEKGVYHEEKDQRIR